ncbi:MAG: tRNA nucleotidyltransferase [Oscillospiraceae bacterium]
MPFFQLPEPVSSCCGVLRGAGYAAHPVGGCVRDLLLERAPGDWDVTTSARPEQVQTLFPHTIPTGIRHGTVTVVEGGMAIEVTTFRREGGYTDARHPDAISFDTDLTGDLARRDFTVNAMALDEAGEVIDPFGGQSDLNCRLIRAVGDPAERFSEDALRILRGVRFAAQLDFTVEEATARAMEVHAPLADKVSAERVRTEVEKALLSPRPRWVGKLVELGVLNRFYTDWKPCDWNELAGAENTPAARWRAFCALTGFPITALPVERAVRMAVLHPEREAIKNLALSGRELYALGLRGEQIGEVQRRLALHVLEHREDNTPERLHRLLDAWGEK